ncbi:MAG: hypothetical protein ACLPLR_06985 [Terriglobales bacterium]
MNKTTYATPLLQKLGDAFMLFFQVVIGTPVLAFFPLAFTVAAWRVFGNPAQVTDDRLYRILLTVYLVSLIPTFLVIVWTCYRAVHWQVELHDDDDALLLGWIGHAKRVSYDDVTFFRRGTLSDRLKQGEGRTRTMPVRIEFLPHKKYTIWLETNDADGLFKKLRDRCAHAAAVDVDGTQYAPLVDREGRGTSRLSRERLIWGGGSLALGLLLLAMALFAGNPAAGSGNTDAAIRAELMRILSIVWSVGFIGFGLLTIGRRASLRGNTRPTD